MDDITRQAQFMALGGLLGAGIVYALTKRESLDGNYPEFEVAIRLCVCSVRLTIIIYVSLQTLEALKQSLNTPAAQETAKTDGAANKKKVEQSGAMGKVWPVRMVCTRLGSKHEGGNTKIIHFIRHGQGFHNSLSDYSTAYKIRRRVNGVPGGINPYNVPEVFDPPLTEIGRQQAKALQSRAKKAKATLIVVSPMCRALMTSNIAFSHLIGDHQSAKWIAHEGCREKSHGNSCDYRRPVADTGPEFPNVDFSLVPDVDPWLADMHEESDQEQARRAYDFMLWIRDRPETEIVVSSHSAWLFCVFNAVLQCDPNDTGEWFTNGEMRSVSVDFGGA
jgi:broad specificity phosphatase PhoE